MRKILLSLFVVFAFNSINAQTFNPDSCCFDIDTLVITGDTTACYGDSVQLCVPYDSCLSYQWYQDYYLISSATSNCIYVTESGSYTVSAWNECDSTYSVTYEVLIGDMLTTTISCRPGRKIGTCYLQANPSGGQAPYTYLWSTGSTNQSIEAAHMNSYVVTVTDAMGCETITYGNCNNCISKRDADVEFSNNIVDIYPNPSQGQVSINLPEALTEATVKFVITDLSGKQLLSEQYTSITSVELNLNHFEEGVYMIIISSDEFVRKEKLIIKK